MHVLLYTTSSCSFCTRARELLERHGVAFDERSLDGDRETRARLARLLGRATMPYVLVDGDPVGGLEELERMARDGELGQG